MDNVFLYPYRVFTLIEKAPYSVVWSAFELAVEKGVDIINMSLGGKEDEEVDKTGKKYCLSLNESISEATQKGIVVVVSAGNNRGNADIYYPACCPEAITVAATNIQNLPDYGYSASGICVDVAAPGTNINSTVPRMWSYSQTAGYDDRTYDPIPKSLYREMSGTSMATPLVSAAAALLKSIDPDITPAEVQRIIKETAYVPEGWDTNYGSGILNFYNMVKNYYEPERSAKPIVKLNSDYEIEATLPEGVDANIYYKFGENLNMDNYKHYTEPISTAIPGSCISFVCHEKGKLISEPVVFWTNPHINLTIERFQTKHPISDSNTLNITWRSFDPDIAKVDEYGNITGVSVGETQIYATLDSGIRLTFTVTVEPPWWQQLLYRLFFGFLWMRI